ncbi:MAG: hypothetical protein LBL76_03035 [Treponema sp.]|nr:hypothetical protein [Treponema sp.]
MVKLQFYLLALSSVLLTSCINISFVPKIEKIDIDHAIPPRGNILETGTLGYAETDFFSDLFSFLFSKEARIPVEGEILTKGSYTTQGEVRPIFRFAYPQKNKNLPQQILINTYHLYYKWQGNIMFSGKAYKANFLIDADGPKSGWQGKTILLDTAKTGFFRFEFSGPIGDTDFDATPESGAPHFPWWVGDFISQGKTYRLNAVVEIGPEYAYPPGFKDPFAYETRRTFFYPEQKFQIIDAASNTVMAEIQNNAYTLYDTLPETEWEAMKCNIGLFYAILKASKQTDASSSW